MVTAAADAPARTTRVSSRARKDAVLIGAVDLAREAAQEGASSPGSSSTSHTVATLPRGTRASVTVQCQPR